MTLSTALIVILMFVAIVGIGIGNILMTLSSSVAQFRSLRDQHLGVMWLLILLLTYLNMFWNCTLIANRENWQFASFLFVISGPVILLFASSLVSGLMEKNTEDEQAQAVMTRFFWLYAAIHLWFIGMDYLVSGAANTSTFLSGVLAAASVALALFNSMKIRRLFTVTLLILIVVEIAVPVLGQGQG